MKITGFLSSMLFWLFTSIPAMAEIHNVTLEDALHAAEREFVGEDVDYYVLNSNNNIVWSIFVDAEPMKGWEHDCYLLVIPKRCSNLNTLQVSKTYRRLPPSGDYVPLYVKNRYNSNALIRPFVADITQTNEQDTVPYHTYALIISGGVNRMINYERYWNDCSFIYQTLTKKYKIPKSHIFPIMSDGENPEADMMHISSGSYVSQPLDLDFDNSDETILAATKQNIENKLDSLSSILQEDDHLFIFVIDHGGTDDYDSESYICLWGNEKLYDHELANLLSPFSDKYVNINVVLGQCYAGGFIDDLTQIGCVVSAACEGSEPSWGCVDIPFDEFVYQWTCAVNKATHSGLQVYSDLNNNGYITIDEAFEYAKNHDRRSSEHPQYISTPLSVGEDLAFNKLAPAIDLYIKDNYEDTGKEPNLTTDKFWLSPSIWIRNQDDGIKEHENPYYSQNHTSSTIYATIHNRGKKAYTEGMYAHFYWALASAGFTNAVWKGRETYTPNGSVTGGPLMARPVPPIAPGDSVVVKRVWGLPDEWLTDVADNGTEKHHFCLTVKLMPSNVDDGYSPGINYFYPKASNKQAQKNVSIVTREELMARTSVFIRNISNESRRYTIELVPHSMEDSLIYSKSEIEMTMERPIQRAWAAGGYRCYAVARPNPLDTARVIMLSPESKLEAISMASRDFDKVDLKFNFSQASSFPMKYTLDLIQRDEDGNIVGGETFIVEEPLLSSETLNIEQEPINNGSIRLTTNSTEDVEVRWFDENHRTIGTGNSLSLAPAQQHGSIFVATLSEEGEMASQCLDISPIRTIYSVSIQSGMINILFNQVTSDNSSIQISSLTGGGAIQTHNLPVGVRTITYDVSSLPAGLYVVNHVIDGTTIDSYKFIK